MRDTRPDPEALLERIRQDEGGDKRGKLKIFFGASAGVGKTYAMLVEAHERRRAGADVVVGVVETHGRPETAALLEGLEAIPQRDIAYRGATLHELDLDRALARKPELLLVDELAHTNAPGSRHAKRWLDVRELVESGIDVYATLNVQHVESVYDVVAQITGVSMRELVPDEFIGKAHEIELVDLPPDDLLQRMKEGKVYIPQQAERARENFFRKGNLLALRELALRVVADRVDAQMESWRHAHAIDRTWPVGGRILVCIGDPRSGLRLLRAARTMASQVDAEWIAVHVERPGSIAPSDRSREDIIDLLAYAEELGAETAILAGIRPADQLLAYARERNVSRIVVGKPSRPRWLEIPFGSLVSTLVRKSGEIDVVVTNAERDERTGPNPPVERPPERWRSYLPSVATVVVTSGIAWAMKGTFALANLIMVYLLGVMWVAVSFGRGPAIAASILSVAAFDFFFVPPNLTFAVSDTEYLVTFTVMLAVALVISTMASRMRQQTDAARRRERRTATLFALSRDLAAISDQEALLGIAARHVRDVFDAEAVILLPDDLGRVVAPRRPAPAIELDEHERGVAQWAFDHEQPAGRETQTLPAAAGLYLPLRASRGSVGILGVFPGRHRKEIASDQLRPLETFANQIALAIERSSLAEQAERARVQLESERLRETLLSSVSHDLRTPLAVITGAGTSLLESGVELGAPTRRELVETIVEESQRLNRLVGNLLDMTRLESGAVQVRKEWHSIGEVLGSTLTRLEPRLRGRRVDIRVPADLPFVGLDDVLMEQVFTNVLDNAVKYTPHGSPLEIEARAEGDRMIVEISDRGPGVAPGEEETVFAKFYRARRDGDPEGAGLGLAISRGILTAHGGTIRAGNRAGGGAVFTIVLPLVGSPPAVPLEDGAQSPSAPTPGAEP